eukprot:3321103-Pleurochrysis_carterae.AAC.3
MYIYPTLQILLMHTQLFFRLQYQLFTDWDRERRLKYAMVTILGESQSCVLCGGLVATPWLSATKQCVGVSDGSRITRTGAWCTLRRTSGSPQESISSSIIRRHPMNNLNKIQNRSFFAHGYARASKFAYADIMASIQATTDKIISSYAGAFSDETGKLTKATEVLS